MTNYIIALVALILLFVLSTVFDHDIGIMAIVAAWLIGVYVAGFKLSDIWLKFPVSMVIALIGITLLVGIARETGTIDWMIHPITRIVGNRVYLIPWALFFVGTILASFMIPVPFVLGALGASFISKYKINPLLIALMIVHSNQGASFSPFTAYGILIYGMLEKAGLTINPLLLFLGPVLFNFIICVIGFFMFGGRELMNRNKTITLDSENQAVLHSDTGTTADGGIKTVSANDTLLHVLTLLAFVALAVGSLMGFDTGMVALTSSLIIMFFMKKPERHKSVQHITWGIVLLIGGMLTFVGVIEKMGMFKWLSEQVALIGSPMLIGLLLNYASGVISFFASSFATIGVNLQLAYPLIEQGSFGVSGFTTSLAISSTIVDISPFSLYGAVILGIIGTEKGVDLVVFRKKLIKWGVSLLLIGPFFAWLIFMVPNW